MKNAMVIINPTAGKNQGEAYIDQIKNQLKPHFDKVDIRLTTKPGHASDLASIACDENYHSLFAMGGDGTINEVIHGLALKEQRPILGVYPAGTFNSLARVLSIPLDISKAIEEWDETNHTKIDLGKVNDAYFIYSFTFGRILEVIHEVDSEEKARLGPLAYLKNIAPQVTNDKIYPLHVNADGKEFDLDAHIFLGMMINEMDILKFSNVGAKLDDGYCHYFVLSDTTFLSKLSAIKSALMGDVENDDSIKYFKARRLELSLREESKFYTDIDGEEGPKLPVTVNVMQKFLDCYQGKP